MNEEILSRYPAFMTDVVVAELLNDLGFTDLNAQWVKGQADAKRIGYVVVAKKRRYLKDAVSKMVEGWSASAASLTDGLAFGGSDQTDDLSQNLDAIGSDVDALVA